VSKQTTYVSGQASVKNPLNEFQLISPKILSLTPAPSLS
jgi:hypothetical protein